MLVKSYFSFPTPSLDRFQRETFAWSNPFDLLEVIYSSSTNLSPTHIDQNGTMKDNETTTENKYVHVVLLTTVALILASLRFLLYKL